LFAFTYCVTHLLLLLLRRLPLLLLLLPRPCLFLFLPCKMRSQLCVAKGVCFFL